MKTKSTSRSAVATSVRNPASRSLWLARLLAGIIVLFVPNTGIHGTPKWQPAQVKPVPLINQPLVPDAVAPGGAGFMLRVNGTGFQCGSVVNWNGSPRPTTFVNHSQLTARIHASDIAVASTGVGHGGHPYAGRYF